MAVWDSAQQGTISPYSHPRLAEALFTLDARLRRRHAVFEYTSDPSCIFRVDIGRSSRLLLLNDGTRLRRGERIARLHFWNEHIPPVPENGPTIAWARQMQQAIATSLRELAQFLQSRPDLDDVAIIRGDVPSGTRAQTEQLARIMARYGFEAIAEPENLPISEQVHRLGENILVSLIVFAQNARTLRLDTLQRVRLPIFLSRRALEKKFGGASESATAGAL